jgi:NAD(P)-dependent dehydrogenase (short-subunit alcohol dehydrogenase family)
VVNANTESRPVPEPVSRQRFARRSGGGLTVIPALAANPKLITFSSVFPTVETFSVERKSARRFGTVDEVSGLITFLASDRGSYMIGVSSDVAFGMGKYVYYSTDRRSLA